jgi:ribonuclease HII
MIIPSMSPASHLLTAGIDEAGRGCVIGPLVVAIVAAEEKDRRWFAKENVRDSKLVPAERRDELAPEIRSRCWHAILSAEPPEIDDALYDHARSLNELEMEIAMSLLRHFQREHADREARILADAMSSNARDIAERMNAGSMGNALHRINAVHHADRDDRTVAAASIIAKAERERRIEALKRELGEDFGCGYCHDAKTKAFLKVCPRGAGYVRWSWNIKALD